MKKLMTTMLAVAVGVGLHAIGNADTGTSFEGLTGDAPYDIYASTGELSAQAANETYWVTNGTETLTVVAGVSDADNRPAPYEDATQFNYLNIKTTLGNPVTRNVSVGGAGTSIGSGFYFDSLVKFTAFDDDPAVGANGEKLAIWLKENLDANDEPISTNLVITAGFLDGQGGAIVTNYTCAVSGVNLNDGGWHRVTVKAIADITSNGSQVPGFVVYVDQVRATSGAEKGIDASALTTYAYLLNSEGSLFPSAVQSGLDKDKIAAVSFDGQGDVDDLLFTATAPDFAKDAEFFSIYLGEHVTSVQGYDPDGNVFTIAGPTNFVYGENKTVQILDWACENGWMKGTVTNEAGTEVTAAYTITAGGSLTANAKLAGAAINGTPYESAAAAFAAISGGTAGAGPFTVTLNTAATSGVELNSASASVVLDLAGNNITAGELDAAAITLTDGTLLVTNSTVTVGEVNGYNGGSALVTAGGALTIAGGIYNGAVDVSAATAQITGGSFSVNDNKDPDSETVPPAPNADLKAAAAAAGNELVVGSGSASYYTVVEKPADVAKIGETGYETLSAAVAAAKTLGDASAPVTITLLANVTEGGIFLDIGTFNVNGLVLDLGGYTYTITASVSGSSDPIDVRYNNILTISNGTLGVSYAARDLVRIYGSATSVVTFKDVTISGANLEATSSGKPVGVLQIEGGTVNIIGSTSINSGSAPYAIKFGNHASQTLYSCETVTLDTTGNIVGDVLLSGGTYVETAIGAGSDIDYYYGTNKWSTWEDANNVVFAARDGELSAVGDENDVSGNLYKEFAQAFAATNEFTLLKDYAGAVLFTTDTRITANGHELTGTLTAPAGYVVECVGGVYQAVAQYTITFVAEGGTVDPASTNYTINSGTIDLPTAAHSGGVGLQFGGWTNETITTAITQFTPSAGNLSNFTLYAKWTAGGPTYPSYLENADAAVKAQYLDWAQTYGADENSVYEDAFLLNVAHDTTGATIDATAISISGTTVTIDINRGNLNGVPYVKKASTVAGLATAPQTAITIVPADQVPDLDNGGRITLENESGAAKFYQIGVQSTPLNQN